MNQPCSENTGGILKDACRMMVENTLVGMSIVQDQKIHFANPLLSQLTEYTRDELSNMHLRELVHPDDREMMATHVEEMKETAEHVPRRYEYRLRCKDGGECWVDALATRITLNDRPAYHFTFIDITQRKHSQLQLDKHFKRLEALRTIDIAISGSFDLRLTLNVVLDEVERQLDADAANVLVLNTETQLLDYAARRGFRTTAHRHMDLRLGEGHAGRAAYQRRRVVIPDLNRERGAFPQKRFLDEERFIFYIAQPLIAKGQVIGVLEIFQRQPFHPDEDWLDFLEAISGQAAIAIDNARLFENLQRSNAELVISYDSTLEGWARALELRDNETAGHTLRVAEMAVRLARELGLSDTHLVNVRRGSILHDVGKMAIPDSILLKEGPLTDDEWEKMKQHPVYAYEMLSEIDFLKPALDIPLCHHERWDGTGYPRGLKGEQIPIAARIFAVVDVWDALESDRPYRKGMAEDDIREHMRSRSGTHFDPAVLETFLNMEV